MSHISILKHLVPGGDVILQVFISGTYLCEVVMLLFYSLCQDIQGLQKQSLLIFKIVDLASGRGRVVLAVGGIIFFRKCRSQSLIAQLDIINLDDVDPFFGLLRLPLDVLKLLLLILLEAWVVEDLHVALSGVHLLKRIYVQLSDKGGKVGMLEVPGQNLIREHLLINNHEGFVLGVPSNDVVTGRVVYQGVEIY